ncbi:MAG TPA: hypothetical protein ENJ42_00215 [Hellea balneolensis]|uniref:Cell division protein FtsL n=1 Tax=Hellea balneolensis TaxID=287478 RepID=A0A7C5LVN4_9PROT|nr:hypothetical protein [Hellea balneolensis]
MIVREPRNNRLGFIGLLAVGIVSVVVLFLIKASALSAQKRVLELKRQIAQEKHAVQLMRAEIAYLERPERLRALSLEYTDLKPAQAGQIMVLSELDAVLEKRKVEKEENGGVQ